MFADQLKGERERLGLTQAQAASLIAVPDRTYWEWEKAKTTPHAITQEGALRRLCEIDADYFESPAKRRKRNVASGTLLSPERISSWTPTLNLRFKMDAPRRSMQRLVVPLLGERKKCENLAK